MPHLDVVSGVDIAAGHHAVDLADNIAVAEVQLSLIQIACAWRSLASACWMAGASGMRREDAIEIPLGILLVEVLDGLFRRPCPRFWEVTELGRALQQFSQRLGTPEKFWSKSGGTSLKSWPLGGWMGRPRPTRIA